MITGGFGSSIDTRTGISRSWYLRNGKQYWTDNDQPCEEKAFIRSISGHIPKPDGSSLADGGEWVAMTPYWHGMIADLRVEWVDVIDMVRKFIQDDEIASSVESLSEYRGELIKIIGRE